MLSVDPTKVADLRARIDAFLGGSTPLTGLDLYFLLERATPLLEFHTMLRLGPRNRTANGLQQSYGDHNRLLLLGLDRLEQGDLAWYRSRLEQPGEIADAELLDCFGSVRALGFTPDLRIALWLGAALHDCGMLGGRDSGIDVEDGVVLSGEIVSALCPRRLQDLCLLVIRNHDYIKDVFLGSVPASFIADQIERLEPSLRTVALAALGMIQVAGAASLGEGRLSRFRVEIFRRCADQRALVDRSAEMRLTRLLFLQGTIPPAVLEDMAAGGGAPLRYFLERIPLHGWARARDSGGSAHQALVVVKAIAERWSADFAEHDHVVIGKAVDLAIAEADEARWRLPACATLELLNGTRAMSIGSDAGGH